jgi:deoxyribonuclease V
MNLEKLALLQHRLAKKVTLSDGFARLSRIAGVDVAYSGKRAYAAAAVYDYESMRLIETKVAESKVSFPYIPTYLSFREAEPMKNALQALKSGYDVLLVNGHGIAHPRGLGIASHLGVELRIPTIGVAKALLCGEVTEKGLEEASIIVFEGREVGYRLAVGKKYRPLFISPGNMVSLASALRIVKACMRGHALPEPLYVAHRAATEASGNR